MAARHVDALLRWGLPNQFSSTARDSTTGGGERRMFGVRGVKCRALRWSVVVREQQAGGCRDGGFS